MDLRLWKVESESSLRPGGKGERDAALERDTRGDLLGFALRGGGGMGGGGMGGMDMGGMGGGMGGMM